MPTFNVSMPPRLRREGGDCSPGRRWRRAPAGAKKSAARAADCRTGGKTLLPPIPAPLAVELEAAGILHLLVVGVEAGALFLRKVAIGHGFLFLAPDERILLGRGELAQIARRGRRGRRRGAGRGARPARGSTPLLLVGTLLADLARLLVLHLLDARALFLRDLAVGGCLFLGGIDAGLAFLQALGFFLGEVAGLGALFDALVLPVLPLVDALGGIDFGRAHQARHGGDQQCGK